MRGLLRATCLLAALAACARTPTQLVVSVDGDLRVPDDADALVLRTSSRGRVITTRRLPLGSGAGRYALPGSFGVVPQEGDDAARPVTLELDVMRGSCRRFTYRTDATFEPGRVTPVAVYLARQCAGVAADDVCAPRELCASDGRTCGRDGMCVDARGRFDPLPPRRPVDVPTNGAAIAITPDDRRAVVALRRMPYVTVLDLDLTRPTPPMRPERRVAVRAVLPFADVSPPPVADGADPEGWAAVIGNDGDTAFVALRRAQRVLRVDNLAGRPHFATASAPTGSEPTALAIAPSGRHLYVTNFGEGTVTVVATATMRVEMTLDLNGVLARSGRLGAVSPRPALAHPRGIVISNDGDEDDGDEVAWVTEFYGQWRDPAEVQVGGVTLDATRDPGFWDAARVGVLYRIPLDTHRPDEALVTLPPVEDTGFDDATGRRTSCSPNLLYAPHWNHGRVYVTGTCASPSGPIGEVCRAGVACTAQSPEEDFNPGNHRTLSHAAVFVVDTTVAPPVARPTTLLTQRFWEMYTDTLPGDIARNFHAAPPDDARRRMPLLPLGMAFLPGDYAGYVLGYGSDAIFRVRFDVEGSPREVGSNNREGFIDLDPEEARRGRLPAGIAINHVSAPQHLETALVVNADTANVSVLDLEAQTVERTVSLLPDGFVEAPSATEAREGRRLFVTGRGRMSWQAQAWNSCETCHPDGLSDGQTWFFARGPRQSPSLDGSFVQDGDGETRQRVFGWNASFDEVHDLENVIRNLAGGVGAMVQDDTEPPRRSQRIVYNEDRRDGGDLSHTTTAQVGLNGSLAAIPSAVPDLARLEAYLRTVRAPRHPQGLDAGAVAQGRLAFASNCAGCHGGPLWSVARRFYLPSEALNATYGRLRAERYAWPDGYPTGLRFPGQYNPALLPSFSATYRTGSALDAANDHLQCAVRTVGTLGPRATAVAAPDVPVREVRHDMTTMALGASGFSPPSLLGLGLSPPYFHAGNARTLEAVFDPAFRPHHTAWCENCFNPESSQRAADVRNIVAFLLSIDDESAPLPIVAPNFDDTPDLCALGQGLAR